MNWNQVITRNHALLVRIVAELFAMLRMVDGGGAVSGGSPLSVGFADTSTHKWGEVKSAEVESIAEPLTSPRLRGEVSRAQPVTERGLPPGQSFTLPRHLYAAIMLILRPCESAIRRLIIIAARGLVLAPRASRPFPAGVTSFAETGITRAPVFQLIDPLKDFSMDVFDNDPQPSSGFMAPFDPALAYQQAQRAALPVNATLLFNRLRAMRLALNDLPRQARRLARWQARQDLALKSNTPYRPMRISPFRPGYPPGYRRKDIHQVDAVLKDVHYFAQQSRLPDTS